jgi:curved DNA-binding protein CbpA
MALNPAEGFLLSRIDGHTPWAVLRDLGALPPDEVDLALESWVRTGLVLLDAESPESPRTHAIESPKPEPPPAEPAAPDLSCIDASLDIEAAFQQHILEFEARLGHASYHEILGVGRDSDPRDIKRAYFQRSKQFHPDRYFRRNIGSHAERLDRIFNHVALAYELLSDPTTRNEIERSMECEPERQAAAEPAAAKSDAGEGAGYRKPTRMENLDRLRRRFKMPEKALAERRFRARQFYDASRAAAHQKNWLEAAASARLAIAFDPWNRDYKEQFASIQADVHAVRAAELLEQAAGTDAKADALRLLEEAIHYRPADAALHARAAGLALDTGAKDRAREYAENAVELEPEEVSCQLTLCRVLRRTGDRVGARRVLSIAEKLAPKDPEVLAEQRQLQGKQ